MKNKGEPGKNIIKNLQERAKELNCLYKVEDVLNDTDLDLENIFHKIIEAIPPGWQYPEICRVKITYEGAEYTSRDFQETNLVQSAGIFVQGSRVGSINVYYIEEIGEDDDGVFLQEERKLIDTVAERLGNAIYYLKNQEIIKEWEKGKRTIKAEPMGDWRAILDMLRLTDQKLFLQIVRKMMNYLSWSGNKKAISLMQKLGGIENRFVDSKQHDCNRPSQRQPIENILSYTAEIYELTEEYLSGQEIMNLIQKWIQEDKSNFLVKILSSPSSSLSEIIAAVSRYHHLTPEIAPSSEIGLRVALIRRFFFDRLDYINIAKQYIEVSDFYDIVNSIVYPPDSRGKLGGKSSGLFLASKILKKKEDENELLKNIKIPKTWYIASDAITYFISYNNLDDITEQKYKEIDQIRLEYPQIIQLFKNSPFPPEIVKGLTIALDEFENSPLIVRSSSLLEDNLGTAFSGKYKSLFLANQGPKKKRLEELMDAISEVYASIFSPDPIQYRTERGLLDFHEEMGILIQEVVGTKIGKYFLPSFAGVAFSNNEFRWSPRIKREDGLIRMVPGLGTRAVDRLSDDYPVLMAPGQPNLRVNVTPDEILRYSPRKLDVIDLETNSFGTVDADEFIKKYGNEFPKLRRLVSVYKDRRFTRPGGLIDYENESLVFTFEGLAKETNLLKKVHAIISVLKEGIHSPVDIEFACDGTDFYLLQCRPQSYSSEDIASPIPKNIPENRIVFSANKFVSNGKVPDISHIIYVDPEKYQSLTNLDDMKEVGRAISKLNRILPKRRFIMMGPGRWGSRGDIKLGVNVNYSDFSNTAMLIEIAKQKGNYIPELSFGTHFFQDLVEASIRYLPLYPDQNGVVFNEHFLTRKQSILGDILPEYSRLAETLRVIDVPGVEQGNVLRILMNAELEKAVGFLTPPTAAEVKDLQGATIETKAPMDDHWKWRLSMAEILASRLDPERFGVKGLYIFGSAKNATAGPASDIDLIVHFEGTEDQRKNLLHWIEGWSASLSEINYLRTGYRTDGLIDLHIVTDEDIKKKTSFASKISAVTDPARPLELKKQDSDIKRNSYVEKKTLEEIINR